MTKAEFVQKVCALFDQMDPWQPISTAPKDGRTIIGYSRLHGVASIAYLGEDFGRTPGWYYLIKPSAWTLMREEPTVWVPMP